MRHSIVVYLNLLWETVINIGIMVNAYTNLSPRALRPFEPIINVEEARNYAAYMDERAGGGRSVQLKKGLLKIVRQCQRLCGQLLGDLTRAHSMLM